MLWLTWGWAEDSFLPLQFAFILIVLLINCNWNLTGYHSFLQKEKEGSYVTADWPLHDFSGMKCGF